MTSASRHNTSRLTRVSLSTRLSADAAEPVAGIDDMSEGFPWRSTTNGDCVARGRDKNNPLMFEV
jgi:hypothetical protein